MSSRKIGAGLLVVAFLVIAGFGAYLLTKDNKPTETTSTQQQSTNRNSTSEATNDPATTDTPLTAEVVAVHSTKDDCWTIIEGKVYDITKYVPRHPGGDEILQACGKDGTSLFTQRKTSDGNTVGSGTPHSSSASSQLEQFFVGSLQ